MFKLAFIYILLKTQYFFFTTDKSFHVEEQEDKKKLSSRTGCFYTFSKVFSKIIHHIIFFTSYLSFCITVFNFWFKAVCESDAHSSRLYISKRWLCLARLVRLFIWILSLVII